MGILKSKIMNIILLVVCIILISFVIFGNLKKNEVIAMVGDKKISQSTVNERLKKSYETTIINELIDESLINQQFDKSKKNITEKEQLEQLNYINMIDSNKKSLTEPKTKKFVNEYLKIKYISESLGLITDEELKEFLEEQKEENGNQVIKVSEISGSHEVLSELEKEIKNKESFDKIISKNDLKVEHNTVFSKYNEYDTDFSNKKVGDVIHLMNGESMDDMQLIIIENVETADSNTFNLNKNKNNILNVYFSKNYNSIKIKVLNELKKIYVIKK